MSTDTRTVHHSLGADDPQLHAIYQFHTQFPYDCGKCMQRVVETLDTAHSHRIHAGPPINVRFLAEQSAGDMELQRELLKIFLTQYHKSKPALCSKNPNEIRHTVHKLNGSALAIGAGELAKQGNLLENQLNNNVLDPGSIRTYRQTLDQCASYALSLVISE